jgi:ferric-dicitrate binding protein FerR (iron transport regulator)
MFEKHVVSLLTSFVHGELPEGEALRVGSHLQACAKCRAAFEEIRFAAQLAASLSESAAPESIWRDLQYVPQPARHRRRWVLVTAAVAMMALLIVFVARNRTPQGPPWEVAGLPGKAQLRPGEALQTDSSSEAQIKIANIGQLTLDPNTRIRLLVTEPGEHRIALDRGRVEATTWAPPRLFIVETPSATAVDLGCRYSLKVEDDGSSLLRVTLGLVALEHDDRETIVPAGAFCRTRKGEGPGTPYYEDSSPEFQKALALVDSGVTGAELDRQLEIVLRESHIRDALSLWHLLPRLDRESRGLVYDRLSQSMPPPSGVTRDGIIALDPAMVAAWKKIVSQLWQ